MSANPRRGPRAPSIRLLFAALLIVGAGNSLLFPIFPPLARELGIPDAATGFVYSLSALIWVFASPYWGRASDRIGRRPIAAMGLAAYAVSMTLFALIALAGLLFEIWWVPIFVGLALSRAFFGLFGSATAPAAQAYVADHTSGKARIDGLALLTSGFAIGAALGPAAGILAAALGPIGLIGLIGAIAAAGAAAIWRYLPEAPRQGDLFDRNGAADQARTWTLAKDPRVAPYIIIGVGLSVVTGTLFQTLGFFVIDRLALSDAQSVQYPAAGFMVNALASLVAQLGVLPRLRIGARALIVLGLALLIAGVLVQIMSYDLPMLLLSQLLIGFGFGFSRPGYASGASLSVRPDEQGAVAGLVVAANGAGFIIAPLTGAVLYDAANAIFGEVGHVAPLVLSVLVLGGLTAFALRSRRLKATIGAAPLREPPPNPG